MRSLRLQTTFMALALFGLAVAAIMATDIDIDGPGNAGWTAYGTSEGGPNERPEEMTGAPGIALRGPGYEKRIVGAFPWDGVEEEFHYIYLAGQGLVVFSAGPFDGAGQAGYASGGRLHFSAGTMKVSAYSESRTESGHRSLYARYYPEYNALWQGIGVEALAALRAETGVDRIQIDSGQNVTLLMGRVRRLERLMEAVAGGAVDGPAALEAQGGLSIAPVRINGERVLIGSASTDVLSGYVYFMTPSHGRVIVSGVPFEGARRQAVAVGNRLTVSWQGTTLRIENEGPVVGPEVTMLWVRRDLGFTTTRAGTGAGDDVAYMRRSSQEHALRLPVPMNATDR